MTVVPDIQEISVKRKGVVAKDGNNSGRFAEEIIFEQADVLLKGTHQYARWLQLRQNNDNSAKDVAENLLERHNLLEQYQKGETIDRDRFDDLTQQLTRSGIRLYTSTQLQSQKLDVAERLSPSHTKETLPVVTSPFVEFKTDAVQPVTPTMPAKGLLGEENLLILTMRCPEIGLSKDIFAYGDQNTELLPLTPLVQELDFAITVDPAAGQAKGWFLSEDRTFSLDVNKKIISINGATYPLAEDSVFVDNNEIYVSSETLSKWFPLDIDTSYSELTVTITPREKLPFQLRNERMNRNSSSSVTGIPLQYPIRPLEYDSFSLPILDVNSNIGYGNLGRDNSRILGAYSVLAQGDLAYMGANVYVSGHEGKSVDTARVRLERIDPEGNLLGPLHANRVAVGDILPVKFPVLNDSLPERGVFISNVDPVRSMDFDTTRFEGNLSPGWDVELYRNGALIWTRKVGLDGRYLFEDVPLYYGKNDFLLKGFGPQGQEKIIEEQALTVGMEMLTKGSSVYQVSASQREKTILGVDERNRYSEGEGGRFSARYQYGLNENLSLTSGASSIDFGGQRHTYLQAGVSGMTSWLYGSADLLYDIADGSGVSFFGQTALGPVDIRVKQEFFSDFVMEDRPENVLKSRTELDLRGSVDTFANLPEFSYRVSGRSAQFEEYTTSNVSGGVSTKIADIYLSNYLTWNYDNLDNETTPLQGNFQASGYVGSLRLSGNVRYDLGDESRLNRYGVEGQWTVSQNLRAGGSVYHESADDDRTTVTARFDWDAGFATVSPSLSYNSDNEYGAFLGLSFSLGQDPVSGYPSMSSRKIGSDGRILGVVYHDNNTNAVFDEGDVLLPDVTVQAVQYRKSEQTDAAGQALITGLNAYEPTDVTLDTDTLEDPFWTVTGGNVAIKPRPGHLDRVEFPVVTTGVIDGTLYFVAADGTEKELVNAVLEIVDEQGNVAMTTRSEYDGFYLFERVLPGDYTLRISPEDKRNAAAAGELAIPVTIDTDGTILAGTDIVLRDPDAPGDPEQLAIMEPYPLSLPAEEEPFVPLSEPENSVVKQEKRVQEQQRSPSVATTVAVPAPLARAEMSAEISQEQRGVQQIAAPHQEKSDRDVHGMLAAEPEKIQPGAHLDDTGQVQARPEEFADWAFNPLEGGMRPVVEYAAQGDTKARSAVSQSGPISFTSPIDISSLQPVRRINPFTYDEAMGLQQRNQNDSSPDSGSSGIQERVKKRFRAVG